MTGAVATDLQEAWRPGAVLLSCRFPARSHSLQQPGLTDIHSNNQHAFCLPPPSHNQNEGQPQKAGEGRRACPGCCSQCAHRAHGRGDWSPVAAAAAAPARPPALTSPFCSPLAAPPRCPRLQRHRGRSKSARPSALCQAPPGTAQQQQQQPAGSQSMRSVVECRQRRPTLLRSSCRLGAGLLLGLSILFPLLLLFLLLLFQLRVVRLLLSIAAAHGGGNGSRGRKLCQVLFQRAGRLLAALRLGRSARPAINGSLRAPEAPLTCLSSCSPRWPPTQPQPAAQKSCTHRHRHRHRNRNRHCRHYRHPTASQPARQPASRPCAAATARPRPAHPNSLARFLSTRYIQRW